MVSRRFMLSCIVVTLACTSASVFKRPGLDRSFDAVPEDSVRIFDSFEEVPGEYVEIADIEGKGNWIFLDEEDVYGEIIEQAAKLGANALVLQGYAENSFSAGLLSGESPREGRGVAIRMLPADSADAED